MGKFVYIYYAGSESDGGSNEEWMSWFGKLGKKIMDPGNPFSEGGQAVNKDGVMAVKEMPATGYSIVEAKDMDEAVEMAKDCPLVGAKNGAVCVYEALPM
jgi:predicted metal-binding transcription factor (methanogenesis marker protein 9)